MDVLTKSEIDTIMANSRIKRKYDEVIDRESAHEILGAKIEEAQRRSAEQGPPATTSSGGGRVREEKSTFEKVLDSPTTRQIGRTVAQTLTKMCIRDRDKNILMKS